VTALQAYLFKTLDMLMLLAYPKRGNTASIRLLQSLGYTENTKD
jgi:RimJ/RimL family protein N-acetyltransferase